MTDSVVHVDKQSPIEYPEDFHKLVFPELENVAPESFDVDKLIKMRYEIGEIIREGYGIVVEDLKKNNFESRAIGFRELKAIQSRGSDFFRERFLGEMLIGWSSPIIVKSNGVVLGNGKAPKTSFDFVVPALYFPKNYTDDMFKVEWLSVNMELQFLLVSISVDWEDYVEEGYKNMPEPGVYALIHPQAIP